MIEKLPEGDVSPDQWKTFQSSCTRFENAIVKAIKETVKDATGDYMFIVHALTRVLAFMTIQNLSNNMDELVMGTLEEYLREMRKERNRRRQDESGK